MSPNTVRATALCAMLGGALWVLILLAVALKAPGAANSDTGYLIPFMHLPVLLIVAALVGVHRYQAARTGYLGVTAFVLTLVGGVFYFAGVIASGWGVDNAWEFVFVPGFFIMTVGTLLFAASMLLARVLPLSGGLLLLVGTLLLKAFNLDDWHVLLALPFGLAWFWIGYLLWKHIAQGKPQQPTHEAPTPIAQG
jgi:hypothetical protein